MTPPRPARPRAAPFAVGDWVELPNPFGRCAIVATWPARPGFQLCTVRHAGGLAALKLYTATEAARARAARSARLQRQARGPFTLRLLGAWAHARGTVVLEEWAGGLSLAVQLDRERAAGQPAPLAETLRRAHALARAVADAHAAGVLHRDIKPDNVLFRSARAQPGDLRLADFGLARAAGTRAAEGAGTLAYQAPEVAAGAAHTPAADVFSLGASIIEMLVGMAPYEGDTEQDTARALHAGAPFVHSDDIAFVLARGGATPAVGQSLLSVLQAMLARDARQRVLAKDVVRFFDLR